MGEELDKTVPGVSTESLLRFKKQWKTYKTSNIAFAFMHAVLSKKWEEFEKKGYEFYGILFPPEALKFYFPRIDIKKGRIIQIGISPKDIQTLKLLKEMESLVEKKEEIKPQPGSIGTKILKKALKSQELTPEERKLMEVKSLRQGAGAGGGVEGGVGSVPSPVMVGVSPDEYKQVREKLSPFFSKSKKSKLSYRQATQKYYEKIKSFREKQMSFIQKIIEKPISYDIYEFGDVLNNVPTANIRVIFLPNIGSIAYVINDYMELNDYEEKVYNLLKNAVEETPNIVVKMKELYVNTLENVTTTIAQELLQWINTLWDILNITQAYKITKGSYPYIKIVVQLLRYFVGFQKINYFFYDKDNLEDLSYVGIGEPVYLRYKGILDSWIPTYLLHQNGQLEPITFYNLDEADNFVRLLAQKSGGNVNSSEPIFDGKLPDDSRINLTYGTVITDVRKGATFTIRFKSEKAVLPLDLINWGTANELMMAWAWMSVETMNTASIFIAGQTAVGKTTTLQAILYFIPRGRKILTIEDTPELRLPHEHWVAKYTRRSLFGGKEITMFDLVKSALRERPDYIIVQEVRGKEAQDMFQAMASGHACLTTLHAGSFAEAIERLISPPIQVPKGLVASSLKQLWLQLFVPDESGRPSRKIAQINEVAYDPETKEIVNYPLFQYDIVTRQHKPTPYFVKRIKDDSSIIRFIMAYNGLNNRDDFLSELIFRASILRDLANIWKIYKNRHLINVDSLTVDLKRTYYSIIQFWEKYLRMTNYNVSHAFFRILQKYYTMELSDELNQVGGVNEIEQLLEEVL